MVREPSIFNMKAIDDVVRHVGDFIYQHCDKANVEIEAKFGIFIDKYTQQRFSLPACTETILTYEMERNTRFESNMPLEQHRHFNKMFNDLVSKSNASDHKGERIRYKHTRETDRFYAIQGTRNKWRVTTDQQTGAIVPNGIVEKVRVADLNVFSPKSPLDYRISINIEIPREKPTSEPVYERNKDRLSYKHGGFTFDLTQVKGAKDREPDVRHELELEVIDPTELAREKTKLERKEPSQYQAIIETMMNNIRLLSRKALKL
ncbi:CYTH-like domain-containing protein [Syncephalastrum racemosum]|uniref:mRNA-capping enzyme subunit beta n=1 Tax=Syncephalastrum racemosum TaxID=13706 RepID=A0A1X2HDF0_SYNRA|nr:CYTH-like domain-containing protein [Syncephalastrum racemosum]